MEVPGASLTLADVGDVGGGGGARLLPSAEDIPRAPGYPRDIACLGQISGQQSVPTLIQDRTNKINKRFQHYLHDPNTDVYSFRGCFQRARALILLQKYRDTNGSHVVIQIGGVYTAFCQEEGIHLHKYRDRIGRCIAILANTIGVGSRFLWTFGISFQCLTSWERMQRR